MEKNTVIITGGAQGIGKAASETFLKSSFNVVIFDSDKEALAEVEKENQSDSLLCVLCDISEEYQVISSVEKSVSRFGRIDILINNAGIGITKPLKNLSFSEWNKVIGTNLSGAFLCSKETAPWLKKTKGCIINIASTRAFMSEPDTEAYSASKGGIVALTHAMAISMGPDIRVNCISPGWIEVSEYKKASAKKKPFLSEEDHMQHPAGRVGEAADIVNMMLFLANPVNSFITGQNFIIDGGMTKKMIYI